MNSDERNKLLAEKMKRIQEHRCKCGRMNCNQDHAICLRCRKENNIDAIPGRCTSQEDGKTRGRHAYAF